MRAIQIDGYKKGEVKVALRQWICHKWVITMCW